MMELVTLLSYILFSYGITTMLIYFNGPFDIIEYFRKTMNAIHPKLGELFQCPFCLSTWIGGLFSIINYLWIPIKITPFNMILAGSGLWWLIIPMDSFLTCGTVWFLHVLDEYLENNSKTYEDQ